MLNDVRKRISISNRQIRLQIIVVLLAIISVALALSGCRSNTASKQLYKNPQLGLSLEYPDNWELETGERLNNLIVLESKQGLFERDSARIEILVGWPISSTIGLEEGLEKRINNKGRLHNLDSVTIVQSPSIVDSEEHRIAKATISIPTMSIPANSHRNQMGHRDPNLSQIIDMYTMRNDNKSFLEITVYRGNSKELNAEAEEIVNSIRFIISNQP